MGLIAKDAVSRAANRADRPQTLWQGISRALDRFVVCRSRLFVPAVALRRSKYDFDRCRQLMLRGSISPVTATVYRVPSLRVGQTAQARQ
jgi:hypothetical protein